MMAKRGLIYSVFCVLLLGSFLSISQPADATSGSITIAPGETKYLSFGTCTDGDVLLWDLNIETWSTIFEYWLQTPSGSHTSLYSLTSGQVVHVPGEWKLGFSIDSSGFWSATVSYTIERATPSVRILAPLFASYVSQAELLVSGTVDSYASEVAVSLDGVHFEDADLYLGAWNKQVTLPFDGEHAIYAEATIVWGTYTVVYQDLVMVTLDRVLPDVVIVAPGDGGLIRGNYADISWQCSDDCGIAQTEMKIDGWGWSTVTGNSYGDLRLATGEHTIQIRVTDVAGNQATDSTTFTVDARALSFDGPYYGLPLLGIVLAIAIAAVAIAMLLRRRRGGAAVTTVPEDLPPQGARTRVLKSE